MPKVTREPETPKRALRTRPNALVIAAAATLTSIAMLFAAYTHSEVVALRAEVHEARVAAKTATLAADRATTAADAAQSALASAQAPQPSNDLPDDSTPNTDTQPDPQASDTP